MDHWLLLSFACVELQILVLIYFLLHRTLKEDTFFTWRNRVSPGIHHQLRVQPLAEHLLLDFHTWFPTCFSSSFLFFFFFGSMYSRHIDSHQPDHLHFTIPYKMWKSKYYYYCYYTVAFWSWFYQWHVTVNFSFLALFFALCSSIQNT